MFNFVRQPSRGAGLAIGYITGGSLAMIWAGIWWHYMRNNGSDAVWKWYVCTGLFLSGLAVFLIGLFVGRIGKAAKSADANVGVTTPSGTVPVAGTPQAAVPGALPQVVMPPAPVAQAPGAVVAPTTNSPVTVR